MSTRTMVTLGVCGAALLAGAGLAMSGRGGDRPQPAVRAEVPPAGTPIEAASLAPAEAAPIAQEPPQEIVVAAAPVAAAPAPKRDCREAASAETGFDPAATPYPVREDAGNRQILKGAAVGAAAGAVGGEVIADRAGKGAAVGAAAGALGGLAVKKSKQRAADERYDQAVAAWNQAKARYDAALETCLAG